MHQSTIVIVATNGLIDIRQYGVEDEKKNQFNKNATDQSHTHDKKKLYCCTSNDSRYPSLSKSSSHITSHHHFTECV